MSRSAISACLSALAFIAAAAAFDSADAQSSQPAATVCDSYARDYERNASRRGQVLGGGAVGSLVGLGIGAIAGASGVGAAIGAGVGMIGGGAKRHSDTERMYRAAYQDCMAGRIR